MPRLLVCRHATAVKNLAGTHGGPGSSLAPLGHVEAERLADQIMLENRGATLTVLHSDKPQCRETADIVTDRIGRSARRDLLSISPYYLGLLDGLSDEEATMKFPEVSERMKAWREGMCDISDLRIPEADDPVTYFENGRESLNEILSHDENVVIVGTRSVLVLVWNLLLGNRPQPGGEYREVPWMNAELRKVSFSSGVDCFGLMRRQHEGGR